MNFVFLHFPLVCLFGLGFSIGPVFPPSLCLLSRECKEQKPNHSSERASPANLLAG